MLCVAGYAKDTIVGACHRTSDGQEHKLFGMLEQNETRFFTYVTQRADSKAASHCHDERLAWVTSQGQGTSCSISFVSKILGANCKRANNFHPLADRLGSNL